MPDLLARVRSLPTDRRRRLIGAAVVVLSLIAVVAGVLISASSGTGASRAYAPVAVTSAPAATPTPSALLVQVSGAVRRPGIVSVPDGSRALDAVTAAGGLLPTADPAGVNLAARVADGQQLTVPVRGAAPAPAGSSAAAGPFSLNSATEEQLETLPRIGPATAARILAWRAASGPFRSVDDLTKVGGIGPKTLAALRGLVTP